MSGEWARLINNGPNAGDHFAAAFKEGMRTREQNMAKAAYAALIKDPNNDKALEALGRVNPEVAGQFMQQRREQAMKATEQFQGTIKTAAQMAQRMKAANPQMPDDQVYMQVRSGLIQMRMPGAEQAPAVYDKQYFDNVLALADPEKGPGSSEVVVTPQAGAPAFIYNKATGVSKQIVFPEGQAPKPLTDAEIQAMEGGQSQPEAGGFPE